MALNDSKGPTLLQIPVHSDILAQLWKNIGFPVSTWFTKFMLVVFFLSVVLGFQVIKNLSANAGDLGEVPGWGRSPGEGNGNLL